MSGQHTLYEPGAKVTVTLVADSGGNVATAGDAVALTGENSEHPEVALVETAGNGIGHLDADAEDYDPDATYSAGEAVGEATVLLRMPVDWFVERAGWDQSVTDPSTTDAAVGDKCVYAPGGEVQLYTTEDASDVVGVVFRTISGDPGTVGKVAVARFR